MWRIADKDILFAQMPPSNHNRLPKTEETSAAREKGYYPHKQIPEGHFGKTRSFEGRGEV